MIRFLSNLVSRAAYRVQHVAFMRGYEWGYGQGHFDQWASVNLADRPELPERAEIITGFDDLDGNCDQVTLADVERIHAELALLDAADLPLTPASNYFADFVASQLQDGVNP